MDAKQKRILSIIVGIIALILSFILFADDCEKGQRTWGMHEMPRTHITC